ncbi:hypothetical protein [Actinosynnema sp. NPDC020468]|uniref:hypothetical protein n=1 Tax=Actinosynnema sp. NPDC020468 TaxID=3154488 RepID=UPI0033C93985
MDFWGAVRTLRRRWYIALPAALLAVGVAGGVFLSIPTRYQSTGVMVLTTPAAGGTFSQKVSPDEAVKINPLLAFDGSLATTSQIMAQILMDPKTREEGLGIPKDSPDSYTATGGGQNGPFFFVTGESNTPEDSEKMVTKVLDFAAKQLDDQQRKLKAPESTFITSQVIVNPTEAQAQIGGKVRYAGAAFVLLMLLTTAATFGADSIINNVKRRKAKEAGEAEQAEPTPTEPEAKKPEPAAAGATASGNGNGDARRSAPAQAPVRRLPTASEQTVKVSAVNAQSSPLGTPAAPGDRRVPQGQRGQAGTGQGGTGQPGVPGSGGGQAGGARPPAKAKPTASEQTVKIAAPPQRASANPGWPTSDDRS